MKHPHRYDRAMFMWGVLAGALAFPLPSARAMQAQQPRSAESSSDNTAASGTRYAPGTRFRDCSDCPEMMVVPRGNFIMGSPPTEKYRFEREGPQHEVKIARDFAVGVYHVTRAEYGAFARETKRATDGGCFVWSKKGWSEDTTKSWRSPGFPQTDRDPVLCVNWEDAQAYVSWLNKRVNTSSKGQAEPSGGGPYRLLTEAEWEYAARAGTTTPFYWGDADVHRHANAGIDKQPHRPSVRGPDRWKYTSPAGSFPANRFGLHDMLGNAWQWVEDCHNESYVGAPSDGSAWITGTCTFRVARGGCWLDSSQYLRAAYRGKNQGIRYTSLSFRIAKTLY